MIFNLFFSNFVKNWTIFFYCFGNNYFFCLLYPCFHPTWMGTWFKYERGKFEFLNCWHVHHDAFPLFWNIYLCACDLCYFPIDHQQCAKTMFWNYNQNQWQIRKALSSSRCDGFFRIGLPTILAKTFMWAYLSSSYGYLERFL
jgi:hypothetical protein